jgi:DNA polymerase-3 subunit gamma/tau
VPEIVDRLKEICQEESIAADEASLLLIARKGDGALRDALSVFDQAVALCGADVKYDALADALGVVDVELFFELTRSVRERDPAGVLNLVQRIVSSGFDFREFLAGVAEHLRNLFVAVTMADTSLIEASSAIRDRYASEAPDFSRSTLLRLLSIAAETEEALRVATRPRLQMELGLLKMVSISDSTDLREAIRKIDELRKLAPIPGVEVAAAGPAERASAPAKHRSSAPESPPSESWTQARMPGRAQKQAGPGTVSESSTGDVSVNESSKEDASDEDTEVSAGVSKEASSTESQQAGTTPAEPAPRTVRPSPPDLFGPPALGRKKRGGLGGGSPTGSIEGSTALAAAAADELAGDIEKIPEWLPFVKAVKSARIHVGSLLQHTAPRRMAGDLIEIDVPDDFHKRLLENQQDFLLKHARTIIRDGIRSLRFSVRANVAPPSVETAEDFDPYEYMQQRRKDNPVIRAIFDEFGGELVW